MSEQPSSFVEQELASQPDCWAEVVAQLDRFVPALPRRGERVAVVGCGTSLYMSRGYAALREAAGDGETDAFPASEYPAGRRYDRIVAITRSGTTTEVVDLLRSLAGSTPTTTITADAATPAAELATDLIELTMATEQSVVQTRFPTASSPCSGRRWART